MFRPFTECGTIFSECGCLRQATLMLVPAQTILSSTRKSVAAKCGSP